MEVVNHLFDYLLSNHSWYALFKLHWIVFVFFLSYFYIKHIVRSPLYPVTKNQQYYFFTGMALVFLLKATPFDVIGTHYLFSAHVFQLSVIFFIVVPLIILSLPVNFLRKYIWHHRTKFALNILAHPWLTLITFNGFITIYLIPAVFNFIHSNVILSILAQAFLLFNAIFMWWVIIHPVPEIKGFNYLLRALYIFLASLALFPIGFYYVIIQNEHFPTYIDVAGAIIPALTPIYDQQLAGGILKVIQLATYSFALLFILFKWGKIEQEKEGQVDEEHIRYVRGVVIHLDKNKKR